MRRQVYAEKFPLSARVILCIGHVQLGHVQLEEPATVHPSLVIKNALHSLPRVARYLP